MRSGYQRLKPHREPHQRQSTIQVGGSGTAVILTSTVIVLLTRTVRWKQGRRRHRTKRFRLALFCLYCQGERALQTLNECLKTCPPRVPACAHSPRGDLNSSHTAPETTRPPIFHLFMRRGSAASEIGHYSRRHPVQCSSVHDARIHNARRGHATVDVRLILLAPALIPPPIPTSPHVATLE